MVMVIPEIRYGAFIDAMAEAAQGNIEAEVHLQTWKDLSSPEEWVEFRVMSLEEHHVTDFTKDMVEYLRRELQHTCTDARMEGGHAFLKAIHAKLTELGVEVDLAVIDVPLTSNDTLVRTQNFSETN